MLAVRKGYIFIDHIPLEVLNFMASVLEAGPITDFSVGFAGSLAGEEVGQRDLPVHPFPLQMIGKSRLIMALCTHHMFVA
jgi:hypothetical protein